MNLADAFSKVVDVVADVENDVKESVGNSFTVLLFRVWSQI